jgi:hypothetical protein
MPLIGAVLLAINVALVVHTIKTGRFWPWAYVILMIPGAGAIAYVVVELVPEWLGTHQAQTARRRIGKALNPEKTYRALHFFLWKSGAIALRSSGLHVLEHFPITPTPIVSLPGLTGQSSTHGRRLLDRPVKPRSSRAMTANCVCQPERETALVSFFMKSTQHIGWAKARSSRRAHAGAKHGQTWARRCAPLPTLRAALR